MSHFVGLVFGDNIEDILEPYNENREVDEYVVFTKDEAVDEVKKRHADEYEWALKHKDDYTNPKDDWEKQQQYIINRALDRGLFTSYEDAWEEAKKWGYRMDENENLLSTYNPDSKWDWYVEGGRFNGFLILNDGSTTNYAEKGDVDWQRMFKEGKLPFCFVTEDGEWHESAEMGWWGMTTNDKEDNVWDKEFKDYLNSISDDTLIIVIDFHI